MKRLTYLLIALALSTASWAQEQNKENELTTIILVRHAEKSTEGGGDPNLTPAGEIRAKALSELLQNTDIDIIFSTPFKRTKQTIKPLAESNSLTIQEYNPFKIEEVMDVIKDNYGKTMVFSGHSNTTPILVNKIAGVSNYKQLHESDYDNLYIITISEVGAGSIIELQYGEASTF